MTSCSDLVFRHAGEAVGHQGILPTRLRLAQYVQIVQKLSKYVTQFVQMQLSMYVARYACSYV
jgi:hypothetical protein